MDYFTARQKVFGFIDSADQAFALGAMGSLVSTLLTQVTEEQRNEALKTIAHLQAVAGHRNGFKTGVATQDATAE